MPDKQLFTFRNPVGVVAVVTAGNFPVAVPSWYLVPALLCGDTVVWKPAEYAAASALALYDVFVHAELPSGVLQVVLADGAATCKGLSDALDAGVVDKVGFTGSTAVGTAIGELCGRHLQSPCLELGGKNPMVVTPSARLDLAVEGALFAGFGTAGQRCTSLGTVLVHESRHDEFVAAFSAAVELANAPGYGLSSAIYTEDPAEVFAFRRGISAGMVSVNNSTSGAEAHLPFGGNGRSGNGSRQSGRWVLDQFTRWQAVNWDYSGRLQKAQLDVAELTADLDYRLT